LSWEILMSATCQGMQTLIPRGETQVFRADMRADLKTCFTRREEGLREKHSGSSIEHDIRHSQKADGDAGFSLADG